MNLILKNGLKFKYANLLHFFPLEYVKLGKINNNKQFYSDFKISKLSNGIRVATKGMGKDNGSNSLTFGLWVDSGSRNEELGKNGVAHFLEHLIFKGTFNRSKKAIEKEIEDMGAHLNAYTTREQTVYQMRCFVNDLPKCMNLLSDIIQNSKICKSAIENERNVILREMEEVAKSEEEILFDDLHKEIYKDNLLGNTILGPKENILTLKREDLIDYIKKNYIPEKMLLLGVGNIEHELFKDIAEESFKNVKGDHLKKQNINFDSIKEHSNKKKPVLIQRKGNIDGKLYLSMGYNGVSWKSEDFNKIMFLQSMLGEYGSNRINRSTGFKNQILEKILAGIKDYIEYFETFNICYKDTGLIGWYFRSNNNLTNKNILDVAKLINSRFKNLHSSIKEEDIIRVKRILSYQIASLFENSGFLFEEIGRDLIINNRYSDLEEKLEQVKKIDLKDIKDIIQKYFNYDHFDIKIKN